MRSTLWSRVLGLAVRRRLPEAGLAIITVLVLAAVALRPALTGLLGHPAAANWATVFVGTRMANGDVAGSYADVPKGARAEDGSLAIVQVSGTRRLAVAHATVRHATVLGSRAAGCR